MTEFAHDGTECFSRGCQPILVAGAVVPGTALDNPVQLQIAQPRHQHRARDQRHAAMEVVEGADIGHQLAQDQRHPALGENL